ncbi:hypothetical protein P167DRAFT_112800 [Morchella conica CCBAS932]|uniref:Uncharacterized protein n=1 Tax=Morchella conica CCBAS932 TaxID=1392247 RepID=A0A3N4KV95_9PEZI|nr:hypothetical protein P167DRAFT_112800 [Morchella conica CCBAS932]
MSYFRFGNGIHSVSNVLLTFYMSFSCAGREWGNIGTLLSLGDEICLICLAMNYKRYYNTSCTIGFFVFAVQMSGRRGKALIRRVTTAPGIVQPPRKTISWTQMTDTSKLRSRGCAIVPVDSFPSSPRRRARQRDGLRSGFSLDLVGLGALSFEVF